MGIFSGKDFKPSCFTEVVGGLAVVGAVVLGVVKLVALVVATLGETELT